MLIGPIARPFPASIPAGHCASRTRAAFTRPNTLRASPERSLPAVAGFTRTRAYVAHNEADDYIEVRTE